MMRDEDNLQGVHRIASTFVHWQEEGGDLNYWEYPDYRSPRTGVEQSHRLAD